MTDLIKPISASPPLTDPILLVALAARRRGGRAAGYALADVVDLWNGDLVASIDVDDVMDMTIRRPEIRRSPESIEIEWPEGKLYAARPPGAKHDFLLLIGFEPHFRWRTFAEAIADYTDSLGVKTLVSIRVFPGAVPHTRPTPILINASDLELELQFGVQAGGAKYEGEADIGSVLAARGQQLGWQTVDMTVLQPNYTPRGPNPAATLAIVTALDHAFGTNTSKDVLREAVTEWTKVLEGALSDDAQTRAAIAELEQTYDTGAERLDFLTPSDERPSQLPSAEVLIEDIERLFREGGS